MRTYTVDIDGRKEDLPVLQIGENLSIAFFNLHGNAALTEYCGTKLAKKLREVGVDCVITAESKGLQLAHVTARELGHDMYAVARKSKKLYMQDGIEEDVKSITTGSVQHLYLSAHDAELLKGKRVAIVDDVVSTGGSLHGLEALVEKADGKVVARAFVLAEGDAKNMEGIIYLGHIPLL